MRKYLFVAALFASLAAGAHAGNAAFNIEDLPHSTYKGANGTLITIIRYDDQTWTEVEPSSALSAGDSLFRDVCFEGKFESFLEPVGLKLTGVDGRIIFEDKAARKAAPELRALDNVWICGTLQTAKNGRGQELLIHYLAKLQPDAQRFETKFVALELARNVNGLIELGQKIEQIMKNNREGGLTTLTSFDRLSQLRDKAWSAAIGIKEKDRKPNDASACYDIAVMYRDLMHRNPMYRQWVMKALEIDPDHSNAGRDAERIFNMVRDGDGWKSKTDYEQAQKDLEQKTREMAERAKAEEHLRSERRTQEIAERTVRLLEFQAALRTSDADARGGAIKTLGEEIKKSLDLGFALSAVDILTNMSDPAAIQDGMDAAAKSEFIEVRQLVYASLAWRAAQRDYNSQIAYAVLASALKTEKLKEPAQAASSALVESGGKGAVSTLIAGLESNELPVCEALIDGLKKLTHLQFQKKDEWINWWHENKDQTPAKSFENASAK